MTTSLYGSILSAAILALSAVGCGGADNAGAATGAATAAITRDGESFRGGRHARMTARFDANRDGVLQVSELPERARERLAAADANRDGVLADDEMRAHFEARRAARFAEQDANHDGALDAQEAGERWTRLSRADANGDQRVTREELDQAFAAMRAHGPGEHRGMGPGMGHGPRGRHAPDPARMIQRFDANGDGALQVTEAPAFLRERLAADDANRDGALSVEELRAAMERFRAQHPEHAPPAAPPAATDAE